MKLNQRMKIERSRPDWESTSRPPLSSRCSYQWAIFFYSRSGASFLHPLYRPEHKLTDNLLNHFRIIWRIDIVTMMFPLALLKQLHKLRAAIVYLRLLSSRSCFLNYTVLLLYQISDLTRMKVGPCIFKFIYLF